MVKGDLPRTAKCRKCGKILHPRTEVCNLIVNRQTLKPLGYTCVQCHPDYDILCVIHRKPKRKPKK